VGLPRAPWPPSRRCRPRAWWTRRGTSGTLPSRAATVRRRARGGSLVRVCAGGWQGRGGGVCAWTCVRVCVGGCAGAFQTAGQLIHRNPASGWFNVFKSGRKWVGVVGARGVNLRTSLHAEAWCAAVELEWLLDLWCREHGAWVATGLACMPCNRACGPVGAGVARSEFVSNLPQLQAAGHVDAEGRLVKPVVVRRLRALPAPRLGAPKPLVRVRARCGRCTRGAPTRRRVVCGCAGVGVGGPHRCGRGGGEGPVRAERGDRRAR
jgi:hypothetical protein